MRRIVAVTFAAVLPAILIAGCGSSGAQNGGSGGTAASSGSGVVTLAEARQALSRYVTVNNRSNKLRQDGLLATYEGGSSYQIDAGDYRWTLTSDPSNKNYSALSYTSPRFFIPRQSAYPAWFAVRVTQEDVPSQTKKTPLYLVFTKASASAAWLEVRQPSAYGMPAGTVPQVATASGYATQVSPSDATGLALAPDKLPAQDVSYLDVGNIPTTPPRPGLPTPTRPKVINFVNGTTGLGDESDASYWKAHMPAGSSVLDSHQTTTDQIYALRTTTGGVLAFYDLTASLTLGAPFAQPFSITIPGYFNNSQQSTSFQLNYVAQFAVYEPPGASTSPQVLADETGPVSGECAGAPCH
jgi:hypothetical protein